MNYGMQYRPQMGLQTADERQMGLLLHLSQFASFLFPFLGILAPILIWQMNKETMPGLEAHGKMVANWMISAVIYTIISIVLVFVFFIGVIPLIGLMIAGIAFPIIGAVKANDGELWEYPLSIKFLR
jgi:uncharacterized Tic20 family protein